jgi:hypothetical protein
VAGAGGAVSTAPNGERTAPRAPTREHKAADKASAPVGTGIQPVLATVGTPGGASVFAGMGSAPGGDAATDASAPPGYVPPKYDAAAADAAFAASPAGMAAANGGGPLAPQMATAGAVPDSRNALGAPRGAAAFPGSTGGAGLKPNLYPTNDAGTGPAPVGGGGFQPLDGAAGFGSAPLSAANPGLTLGGGGGGGGNPAPTLPAPGGVSFAQQAPVAGGGGLSGDGLVRAPGARSAAALGMPDTQAATTTLTGTGPGGLPIRMTVGRRRLLA